MKRIIYCFILLLGLLIVFDNAIIAAPSDLVYLVEVEGEINPGLAKFIEKSIQQAESDGVQAIILQINTYGGFVDSSIRIRDMLLETPVMSVAFVKDRAWSAGALITLACDQVFMASGSSVGAAETRPNEEKIKSAYRKEFKTTAEKQGRNPDIAAAMVDSDIVVEGVTKKGKLLTLTANEALNVQIADGIASSRQELLTELGFADGVLKVLEPSLADQFARFITNPYVAGLLILIGFIGLIVEAVTLGWGVGGSIGILALTLFFSGNMLVGNTSWGLIILFIAGLLLLALEFFVVPGFGITGIGGTVLVISSLFLTFGDPTVGMYVVSITMIASVVAAVLIFRYFGKSKMWKRIALNTSQTVEKGYLAPKSREDLLGVEGEAMTILRPTGTALFNGERVDVITEGSFISQGSKIKVIKVEGTKVIVREV